MGGSGNRFGESTHALLFRHDATTIVDLHPPRLPGHLENPYCGTDVSGVTCSGVAVGTGYLPGSGPPHALLWRGSSSNYVDLNPSGFFSSSAEGISGGKQIGIGQRTSNGPTIGLVWSGSADSAIELNRFLPPGQWIGVYARGIDEFGNIVGSAYDLAAGEDRAILWIPEYGNGATPLLQIAPLCESGGQIKLQLAGEAGREYAIEKSEDLMSWTAVLRTNIPTPLFYYQEPEVERSQQQFFRAVSFSAP